MKSIPLIAGAIALGFIGVVGMTQASGRNADLSHCIAEYGQLMGLSEQITSFLASRSPADVGKTEDEVLSGCRDGNAMLSELSEQELSRLRMTSAVMNAMVAANPQMLENIAAHMATREDDEPLFPAISIPKVPELPPLELSVVTSSPLPAIEASVPSDGGRIEFIRMDIAPEVLASEIDMVRRSGKSDCTTMRAYTIIAPESGRFDATRGALLHCIGTGDAFLLSAYGELFLQEAASAEDMFANAYSAPIESIDLHPDRIKVAFGTGD